MSAPSQDPGPAEGRTSSADRAASLTGAGQEMSALGNRVRELVGDVGEWPAPAGDVQPLRREPLEVRERILADRLAAALMHHEPGWRLPRPSTLARRYLVDVSQVDQAIEELVYRRIVRRLPNGQIYRASPAEYLLSLEAVPGLASQVDPMGQKIDARRQILRRPCPADVGQALGIPPGTSVSIVKVMWTAGRDPVGVTATYLTDEVAGFAESLAWDATPAGGIFPLMPPADFVRADATADSVLRPSGLFIEMQPPPPSVARILRLAPGQPVALVIVRFDEPGRNRPAVLTVAALRADVFRVLIQSPDAPLAANC